VVIIARQGLEWKIVKQILPPSGNLMEGAFYLYKNVWENMLMLFPKASAPT